MSFRKRNVGISDGRRTNTDTSTKPTPNARPSGTRPSAVDGRFVTSSGSANFDGLVAGHGGIPLGSSILIEESGTSDYAGALLRFYAAEGLMQNHFVHVVGLPEQWGRELPGLATQSTKKVVEKPQEDKMKIAWRYEKLGQQASDEGAKVATHEANSQQGPFCHTFDLSKRLTYPAEAQLKHYQLQSRLSKNCFAEFISRLTSTIASSAPHIVHRVVVPALMSPAIYPPNFSLPEQVLTFQHAIRKLLAAYPQRLVVMQTLPLSLYPRTSGLVKWVEILSDGVYCLTPFPHSADAEFQGPQNPSSREESPQGLLQIHKLPVFHELGSGIALTERDWTFTLSRRKLTIKPFNLPPIEGDTDAQQASIDTGKPPKADMEF